MRKRCERWLVGCEFPPNKSGTDSQPMKWTETWLIRVITEYQAAIKSICESQDSLLTVLHATQASYERLSLPLGTRLLPHSKLLKWVNSLKHSIFESSAAFVRKTREKNYHLEEHTLCYKSGGEGTGSVTMIHNVVFLRSARNKRSSPATRLLSRYGLELDFSEELIAHGDRDGYGRRLAHPNVSIKLKGCSVAETPRKG